MPYRFQPGEDIGPALVRIGLEQIDRARVCLKQADAGKAVHETRKCIKRLRALLRFVRSGIGDAAYTCENRRLGDISRTLSAERDRVVLAATLDQIAPESPAARKLARGLLAPSAKADQLAARRLIKTAAAELLEAREAWSALDPGDDPLDAIATGLERGLDALRDRLEAAADGDDDAVHDWRKAVQRHWRHMRLMEAGWPAYFQSRSQEAKAISELLGRSQDLSLLVRWLEAGAEGISANEATELAVTARGVQDEVRREARTRCLRLTAEGPKAHARHAVGFWTAAFDLVPDEAPDREPAPPQEAAHRVEGRQLRQHAKVRSATRPTVASKRLGSGRKPANALSGTRRAPPPTKPKRS